MKKLADIDFKKKGKRGRVVDSPGANAVAALLDTLDRVMDSGPGFELIKDGDSTTVGVATGKGLPFKLVIKRFNYKGFGHSIARKLTGSRARSLYDTTVKLFEAGFDVPEPVAYVESSDTKNSFYISKYVEGSENLVIAYKAGAFSDAKKFALQLAAAVAGWHDRGAVHGDLKWSNILVQGDEATDGRKYFFVDLDDARLHHEPDIKGITQDLERFYRYGLELDMEAWMDEEFFPAYFESLREHVKDCAGVDIAGIKVRAQKAFAIRKTV